MAQTYRIKELSVERGIHTAYRLAKVCGLNYDTVRALWQNCGGVNPTMGTLEKIATALDVPVSALFQEDTP